MKYFIFIWAGIFILGCTKNTTAPPRAALTIINAVVGSAPLIANFGGTDSISYIGAQQMAYGKYTESINEFGFYSGNIRLGIFMYPDTTTKNGPLYNLNLDLPENTIHTLFLTGTVASPDSFFTTDNPPYHPASDSSVGIRFVNISPGSNPVSVDIKGQANGSEVTNLPYKNLTAFKNYPAIHAISSYVFEFRDASAGTLLGTFTMNGINNGTGSSTATNVFRCRNITIALKGLPGGTGAVAQGTFQINNY